MATSQDARIDYHLRELEIASNPDSPYHVMPTITEQDRVILDLGCGIGQTLLAAGPAQSGKLLVGLDTDLAPLNYGSKQYEHLRFVNASGEVLPFRSASFDLVISRVALPYTDLRRSLAEIRRVLKDTGRVWLTLHPLSMALDYLKKAVLEFKPKRAVLGCYTLANGACFHLFGRQFALPVDGRFESFQTEAGMRRAMKKAGFASIAMHRDRHFLVTAMKAA